MSEKCCGKYNAKITNGMRVKATVLLMLGLGESSSQIALFLGIDDATIYRHLKNYQKSG